MQLPSVCPLCPLHCDELNQDGHDIPNSAEIDSESASNCTVYRQALNELSADSDSSQNRIQSWVHRARQISKTCRPIVRTSGVDLATARTLNSLQDAGKLCVEVKVNPSIQAFNQMVSRDGILAATLADVRRYSDTIVALGDLNGMWPRWRQFIQPSQTSPKKEPVTVIPINYLSADQLSRLSAGLLSGNPLTLDCHPDLVDQWRNSFYLTVIIGPDSFVRGEEDISATMLGRLIRQQNEKIEDPDNATAIGRRAVAMTLDYTLTLQSVFRWSTNLPANTAGNGSMDSEHVLDLDELPLTVQPGFSCDSMMIRGDGSVALPILRQETKQSLRASDRSEILHQAFAEQM